VGEWLEAELSVEPVRILCRQHKAPQSLQLGMLKNGVHQEFGNAAAAMFGYDKDVAKVGERGKISDDTGESDLSPISEDTETERVANSLLENLPGHAARPISLTKRLVDEPDIESA